MKHARMFACGLLFLGAATSWLCAQDDLSGAASAPASSNAGGPVVAPPQSAGPVVMPPTPANAPSASPQAPVGAGPKGDEIYDIRPPFFFLRSWSWLWIVLVTLAAAALIVLLWRWFRGRSVDPAKTAYDLTLERLEKARLLINEENPTPYAVAVSEAIRTYLGQRFQAPSSRRTTDEFLRQMHADTNAPLAEHRDLLGDFLQSCDLVKFARYQPRLEELEKVQQRAMTFVTATKPAHVSPHHNGVPA